MDRAKWNVKKIKGRWWLIRPLSHPKNWIAEHVGTFTECHKYLNRSPEREAHDRTS